VRHQTRDANGLKKEVLSQTLLPEGGWWVAVELVAGSGSGEKSLGFVLAKLGLLRLS